MQETYNKCVNIVLTQKIASQGLIFEGVVWPKRLNWWSWEFRLWQMKWFLLRNVCLLFLLFYWEVLLKLHSVSITYLRYWDNSYVQWKQIYGTHCITKLSSEDVVLYSVPPTIFALFLSSLRKRQKRPCSITCFTSNL